MEKAKLKAIAYENGKRGNKSRERRYLNAAAFFKTGGERFHNIRRAKVEAFILDNITLEINESELLVGRMASGFELDEEKAALVDKYKEHKKYTGVFDGCGTAATGHRVIDYEKLLNVGVEAVLDTVRKKRAELSYADANTSGTRAFYDSVIISLEALLRFAARWRETILAAAGREGNEARRAELLRMAENLEKAPAKPCTHFYEALQCMWLVQFALYAIEDYTLTGRLDNYLWPFYRADIESGYITREAAFELIEHLFYKHNEIYNDWPASVMVGGRDRDGRAVVNELTYMCIEAIGTTGLVNPSVALCYTKDTPDDLLMKSMEMVSRGLTRPSIFNDDLITRGLRNAGVSERDARYYCHSTCVEITPIASSNILVATPYVNSARVLEHILSDRKKPYRVGNIASVWVGGGGMDKENVFLWDIDFKLSELDSFDKFFKVCKEVLASLIGAHAAAVCDFTELRLRYQSCPLSSAFLDDCIECGRDAGAGGARYNFIYPTFPGIINLIDSVAAVKRVVYDEKMLTLGELAKECAENYDGNEPLRRYLTDRCPKFGNDNDAVDSIGKEVYDLISSELSKYKTSIGGTAHPSYFAYIMHGLMGEVSDATPDGRKKGEALSEHLGAVQGMDRAGPTAVMRSVCKLDQSLGIGGIATNYRFTCAMMEKEKGRRAVADLTRVFMKNGGFEVQFNVVNADTLKDARKHPENYRTLLVRVAGYSDYFVNLKPVIQDEIIKRTEHGEI